jgi:2-keto-4-pentenoate hydratase/2-oxohepta-3-ene-1,7-dioic acid hydratase in catechol pathway
VKIFRFKHESKISYGVLKEERLYALASTPFRSIKPSTKGIPIADVRLLPPVKPSKIVAIGVNYKDHAMERGRGLPDEPLMFLMPPSAVAGPNDIIIYPQMAKRVDFEGELAVIIKKKTRYLSERDDVFKYILGYTCFNDVTARDLQEKDGQFTRSKSFDTFAVFGPCIATDIDPSRVRIKTFLNGKLKQSGNTRNLIFPVPYLVRFVSQVMTLFPGDIITTGTPAGVGPMIPGDRVDVQIEGIGTLSNRVMTVKKESI